MVESATNKILTTIVELDLSIDETKAGEMTVLLAWFVLSV